MEDNYDIFDVEERIEHCQEPDDYVIDSDFYHSWESIDKIIKETDKAILVTIDHIEHWIPKSLIRRYKQSNKVVEIDCLYNEMDSNMILVHTEIFSTIIEK